MAKRKSLTKKTRFEVFKRDNFTCQYCGSKAPDSILEIDHIKPIAKGGDNELVNLITSCFECNRGKGERELKDNSIVEKQRIQIEELNIRRQQLEMMLQWRDGLKAEKEEPYKRGIKYFNDLWGEAALAITGEKILKKLIDKFGLVKTLDAIDLSYEKYRYEENTESENFNIVLNKVGGILYLESKPDYVKKIAYIKGIVRNKFYIDEKRVSISLKKYYDDGYNLDELISHLKENRFRNWTSFINYVEEDI